MKMKIKLKICLQVILWLWFERALQDVAAGKNPVGSSISDANLMFEFLLGGVDIDEDKNIFLLDEELASMRSGRAFLSEINDNIPRSRSSMVQMVTTLQGPKRRPMTQAQFNKLVLSMVYSAQQAWRPEREEEKEAWGGVLLQLANTTVRELRGSYLFNYA